MYAHAICPGLSQADWQEMNQSPLSGGGWDTPTGHKHLFLHTPPGQWPEFILWNGGASPLPPDTNPHPYAMLQDQWNKVQGGALVGASNPLWTPFCWIIKGGEVQHLLAVDLDVHHRAMACGVRVF